MRSGVNSVGVRDELQGSADIGEGGGRDDGVSKGFNQGRANGAELGHAERIMDRKDTARGCWAINTRSAWERHSKLRGYVCLSVRRTFLESCVET